MKCNSEEMEVSSNAQAAHACGKLCCPLFDRISNRENGGQANGNSYRPARHQANGIRRIQQEVVYIQIIPIFAPSCGHAMREKFVDILECPQDDCRGEIQLGEVTKRDGDNILDGELQCVACRRRSVIQNGS